MSENVAVTPAPVSAPTAQEPEVNVANSGEKVPELNATPKAPEYHEIKVNKGIRKYTLDELKAKATLGEAAHEKFEQAAKMSKDYGSLKDKLRNNFIETLMDKDLGLSKDQIRGQFEKWYHENYIEPEMLNEDQRKSKELERRLKQYEDEKSQQAEEHRVREEQTLEQHATQEVQQQIIQAIDKSGLPKTYESARKIAYWMRQNYKNGFDAPMEVVVQQVKDSDRQALQSQIANAPIEYIIELFGKELVNKIRKHDLEKLKSKFAPQEQASKPYVKKESKEPTRPKDVENYLRDLRRSKG